MAVPKRKLSKARTRRRKATWKASLKKPTITKCNNCGEIKVPHVICPSCGYYKKRQVLSIKS